MKITEYNSQMNECVDEHESFLLKWHISLNGCHGNIFPFGAAGFGIISETSVYFLCIKGYSQVGKMKNKAIQTRWMDRWVGGWMTGSHCVALKRLNNSSRLEGVFHL